MNCDEEDYIIKDCDIQMNTITKKKYTSIMTNKLNFNIRTHNQLISVNAKSMMKLFKLSDTNTEESVSFLYEIEPLNSTYNTTSTLESSTSIEENSRIDHSNDIIVNDTIIYNQNRITYNSKYNKELCIGYYIMGIFLLIHIFNYVLSDRVSLIIYNGL